MTKFTVAGTSICKGKVKVRFCSDKVLRVKNLQKQGDTDVRLIDLPYPMSKIEACNLLLQQDYFKEFAAEINEARNQKQLKVTSKQPTIKAPEVVEDTDIQSIKELVEV